MTASSTEEFQLRRKQALNYLNAMIKVSKRFHLLAPTKEFQNIIHQLRELESKLNDAIEPDLQDHDLTPITNLRNHLLAHKKFGNKMTQYYKIAKEYAEAAYNPEKNVKIDRRIENAIQRFADIDIMTTEIYTELLKNQRKRLEANTPDDIGILDITGCMILWIAKRESFAYFVMRILKETKAVQGIQNFDIEENCSLDTKVQTASDQNGVATEYVTDITAIRICIAHAHHNLRKGNDGKYALEFEWKQPRGWNFSKTFSAKEFLGHAEKYILFEELQGILLVIAMCEEHIQQYLKNAILDWSQEHRREK
jgi:hypothetical protein